MLGIVWAGRSVRVPGLGLVFLVTFIKKGEQAMLVAGLFMVAVGTLIALHLLGVFD